MYLCPNTAAVSLHRNHTQPIGRLNTVRDRMQISSTGPNSERTYGKSYTESEIARLNHDIEATNRLIQEQEAVILELKQPGAGKRNHTQPKIRIAQEKITELQVCPDLSVNYVSPWMCELYLAT